MQLKEVRCPYCNSQVIFKYVENPKGSEKYYGIPEYKATPPFHIVFRSYEILYGNEKKIEKIKILCPYKFGSETEKETIKEKQNVEMQQSEEVKEKVVNGTENYSE